MKKIFLISFIFSAVAFSQTLIPKLPQITASSFLLIDAETNKIIAQQNPEASTGLASITKIMTSYIVADYLKQGFLNIKDILSQYSKGSKLFFLAEFCIFKPCSSVPVRKNTLKLSFRLNLAKTSASILE